MMTCGYCGAIRNGKRGFLSPFGIHAMDAKPEEIHALCELLYDLEALNTDEETLS